MWQRSTVSCFWFEQNRPHSQRLLPSTWEKQRDPAADPGLVGEADRELGMVEQGLLARRGFERTSKRFGRSLRNRRRKSVTSVYPPL